MIPVVPAQLARAARAWLAEDPDPDTRAELDRLLKTGDEHGLADRFSGRLEFGTAGLRGAMGTGPNRMNVVTVRYAAAGLANYLVDSLPGSLDQGVAIGYDARHRSDRFAWESALVLAGAGLRVRVLPRPLPTPILAHAVRHLGCAAGIMVTASHNPAGDNGYKVYGSDGAQIVPPVDRAISAAIASVRSLRDIPLAAPDDPLIERLDDEPIETYLTEAVARGPRGPRSVRTAYTPLHGVGGAVFLALLERSGFPAPSMVAAQADPDPDFPTTPFPNPEEPGVLELVIDQAERDAADVVLAHDPDADRLAVAILEDGSWRRLTGDEVGCLLAEYLLVTPPPGDARQPLVTTSVVSSRLLAKLAAEHGAAYAETLTGFKWLVRPALAHPELRPALAYEEALGYSIGDLVWDKDGLTAGLAFNSLAAGLRERGATVGQSLERLARTHGLHATAQWATRFDGPGARETLDGLMVSLRSVPLVEVAGRSVVRRRDLMTDHEPPGASVGGPLPPSDVLVLELEGDARLVVRPSGTEPKLKLYFEVVVSVGPGAQGFTAARATTADVLAELTESAREVVVART